MPLEPVGGEHLVPVVGDPAAGPAVPAAAGQAHRVGVGRAEERLGRGGAPVDQQPAAGAVGEAEPADVDGLGVVGGDDAAQAQVEAEAAQRAQPGGQPVDLQVAVQRLLADAAGRLALGVEPVGQVGDRLLEALRDGGEVLLVVGDQGRVGLGGEAVGEVERAGGQGVHVISSVEVEGLGAAILRPDRGLAASPRVRYTLKWEESLSQGRRDGRRRRRGRASWGRPCATRRRRARGPRSASTQRGRPGPS